jgi:hypothetical protein
MTFIQTTYNKPRAFAWSYSKLKNFRTCPKRYWHVDIAKDAKEPDSAALQWGNSLHDAFAKYVAKGIPLPETMAQHQDMLDRLKNMPGDTLVEQKYAITEDFAPTEFFAKDAWYRGIGDIVKVAGEFGYAGDYKTGKVVEDSEQLGLLATCLFAHYPDLQAVRTEYLWLADDAVTRATFKRSDMASFWAGVLPQVTVLRAAHDKSEFPAKPGKLCRNWCPVKQCVHNGK